MSTDPMSADSDPMSAPLTSQKSDSLAEVPPLTASKPDGKPYERSSTVQNEIGRVLRLPQSDWIGEAPDLQNETIVFLIRRARRSTEELYGRLVQELTRRINRIARRWAQGLDRLATEEILSKVEIGILELVLAKEPSLYSDFLEVAFAKAVKGVTLNAVRKHKRSPLGLRGEVVSDLTDEDGEEIERPIELVADNWPNPEEVLLNLQEENQRHQLLRTGCRAVKDRRHLEAVILHHAYGWPITSKDRNKLDLVSYFQATEDQIKYWIKVALEQMRAALGVQRKPERSVSATARNLKARSVSATARNLKGCAQPQGEAK
jgi:hypothetical protein